MKAYQVRTTVMQSAQDGVVCEGDTLSDLTADYCARNGLPIDRGGNVRAVNGVGAMRHHIMTITNRGNVLKDGWEMRDIHILLPGDTGYPQAGGEA